MATLTIYCGLPKPIKATGKNQVRLLEFAHKYRTWHTYSQDKATKKAIKALESKGYLEVIDDQFHFTYPKF